MWLKFAKNYSGEFGLFTKDARQDIINKKMCDHFLKSDFAVKTCPPWEDNLDKNQRAVTQAKSKVARLTAKLAEAKKVVKKTQEIIQTLPEMSRQIKATEDELKDAKNQLSQLDKTVKNEKADKKID